MNVYRTSDLQKQLPQPSVVSLGVFDGVHVGHQRLIEETIKIAKEKQFVPMVHTYDPLPMSIIRPEKTIPELTSLDERIRLINQYGISNIAVSQFTCEMQHQTGAVFFQRILLDKLNARYLVIGFNHRFGFNGDTNAAKLKVLCDAAKIGITVIPPVRTVKGELISSTAIRAAILLEDWELARSMLGRDVSKQMIVNMSPPIQQHQYIHNNGGIK